MVAPGVFSNDHRRPHSVMEVSNCNPSGQQRPRSAMEVSYCNGNGQRECPQRPPEKPRPSTAHSMCPTSADKEALLDELQTLKNAFMDQEYHMKLHIQHALEIEKENKNLENSVESLELAFGLEAPRMGGEFRLIAKLLGLKARLREKQIICNSQEVEIGLLRKDIRVTHCRELEIERDFFAKEVGTLQKITTGLRRIFAKVSNGNKEIRKLRERIKILKSSHEETKQKINTRKENIQQAKTEIEEWNKVSSESKSAVKSVASKLAELQSHSEVLTKLKHQVDCETKSFEHQIAKAQDETRYIAREKIAAQRRAESSQLVGTPNGRISPSGRAGKRMKVPDRPSSPNADAMAKLEREFLQQVQSAAGEFVDTAPASQPPSPRNEDQLQEQHLTFEAQREFFTNKVDDAETRFRQAMEEIEYGKPRSTLSAHAEAARKLAAAEAARLKAEALAIEAQEQARRLEHQAKRIQEQAMEQETRLLDQTKGLQAELDRLRAMGSGDKRWKSEKVTIMVGELVLPVKDYNVQVKDHGVEIDVDVDIHHTTAFGNADTAQLAALRDERASAEAEARRLDSQLERTLEERDRLAMELAALQGMSTKSKRWESEVVSVVVGGKALPPLGYQLKVRDEGSQLVIDVQIPNVSDARSAAPVDEVTTSASNASDQRAPLLDDQSKQAINANIQDVLQYLENISDVVSSHSSPSGPSSSNGDGTGNS
ncbi:uncharacterized protein [Physcomitrium patens]|nr:putative leucine-rich repeat-containing protein DDB_G0290503 [Physcomitrium patens]|eukprot:XP_024382331.1 putative leucine-rich repeat-containing protein DDB_G0290503 [Physcomitrella patens]